MGAHNFTDKSFGKTAADAFQRACLDATEQYGYDSYNGTISTTSGFTVTTLDQRTFTPAAIDRWIKRATDRTEKWGKCECLELPRSRAKGAPRGQRLYIFAGWAAS